MNQTQIAELLQKYLQANCTPEEESAINAWYKQWEEKPDFTDSIDNDQQELLKSRILAAIKKETGSKQPAVTRRLATHKWWIGTAAAALLLILFKLSGWEAADKHGQPALMTYITTNHTKTVLKQMLPDSSVVWLSPGASLNWPVKFNNQSREVTMSGVCFFEVTKNSHRPFIITSAHVITKVWGTSFRIMDSDAIKVAKITVVTGKVSVARRGTNTAVPTLTKNEIMLYPKQEAVLRSDEKQLTTNKKADLTELTLYDHLSLSFEKATLPAIVRVLNKRFDVQISIESISLNNAVMTADLSELNLPDILEVLKVSMKLDYEISGNHIILKRTN